MQESEFVRVRLEVGRRFKVVEDEAAILGVFRAVLFVDVAERVPRMESLTMLAVLLLADMTFPAIFLIHL